jgi:hypothetical protein
MKTALWQEPHRLFEAYFESIDEKRIYEAIV